MGGTTYSEPDATTVQDTPGPPEEIMDPAQRDIPLVPPPTDQGPAPTTPATA